MVNEAAAMPNIVHHIFLSFYSSLISQRYALFALHYACIWNMANFFRDDTTLFLGLSSVKG